MASQDVPNTSFSTEGVDKSATSSEPQLSLPAPGNISEVDSARDTTQTVKLDDLGPMVLNTNGTLSRIHNWNEMSELERERTLRILGKRNQLRRENILASEAEGGDQNAAPSA